MIVWVLYDIRDDRARTRTARHCRRAGLYRVQYSVFVGEITTDDRDTLQQDLEDEINPDHDKVYLFSLARRDLDRAILLGQAFDRNLVSDRLRALFL